MSISPGATVPKDPSAKLSYEFDWSDWLGDVAQLASTTMAIFGPDNALTYDNEAIVSGGKKTTLRLLGGTPGKKYTVTNHIVTDETPAQEDDRSIHIQVREM